MRPRVAARRASGYSGFSQSTYAVAVEPDLIDFQIAALSTYPHVSQRLCSASVGGALRGSVSEAVMGCTGNCSTAAVCLATSRVTIHDLATREFERVMVDVRIVRIYLPEPCDLVIHARFPEKAARAIVLDVVFERQFRAGK